MATITGVQTRITEESMRVVWSGVTENDTCAAFEGASEYGDRSFQAYGTWGGATVVLKGSLAVASANQMDILTDPTGVSISLTSASTSKLKQITELTHAILPTHSGGSSQSLTYVLLCRRNKP